MMGFIKGPVCRGQVALEPDEGGRDQRAFVLAQRQERGQHHDLASEAGQGDAGAELVDQRDVRRGGPVHDQALVGRGSSR